MYLAEMTWPEVREYLKTKDTLLLPLGTCEQHGHHSPLGTDTYEVNAVCEVVSRKYGIVVAPNINYGVHFDVDNDYPGAAMISKTTLQSILKDLSLTWHKQGFKKIIVISVHDVPAHGDAVEELGEPFHLVRASKGDFEHILEKQDSMIHACEAETSLMMYLYPEMIQMSEAVSNEDLTDFIDHLNKGKRFDIDEHSGNIGYATYATSEKGAVIYDAIMEQVFERVDNIIKL